MILTTVGCENELKLSGNYSTCHNGLYAELYIESDSMQSATSMEWISNWVKFEIKGDTLYHLYFGEFADSVKSKINYINKDGFELYYPKDNITHTFKRINSEIEDNDFWDHFYKRRIEFDCIPEYEKVRLRENFNINSFLENPLDLQEFKKKKKRDVTTSVTNGTGYYFNPKINDSIFYIYNFPTKNFTDSRKINQFIVFKYGEKKHNYEDENEILIEMRIFNSDADLGKANLVGLSKIDLVSKFGVDYFILDNQMVYSNKNKILILELENSKVKSFKYIKLSTDKINKDLIEQIIN